mmetsp:Transcript_509/g.1052  ORF Transcript_509/g.1052 Transcript_509/m.1052 type:complete len:304 (-) Transcript_509:59-970(-)
MVVGDLPLSILKDVDKRVSSLDLVTGGTHCEFVDTSVLGPVGFVTDRHTLFNDSLGLALQKVNKVVLDGFWCRSGSVADGWQQDRVLAVAGGDLLGVKRGQSVIPEVEEGTGFPGIDVLGTSHFLGHDFFGHLARVVVGNLPLVVAIGLGVDKGVSSLDLGTSRSHGELVDSIVLGPLSAVTNLNEGFDDLSLRLALQKVVKVVLDAVVAVAGGVADGWQQKSVVGVAIGNFVAVECGEGIVPQSKQSLDLRFANGGRDGRTEAAVGLLAGDGGKGRRASALAGCGANESSVESHGGIDSGFV